MSLLPHQERVVAEKQELDDKLNALEKFLWSQKFQTLPQDEKGRLGDQLTAMKRYSDILGKRIAAFGGTPCP